MAIAERELIVLGRLPEIRKENYRLSVDDSITVEDKITISLNKIRAEDVSFENDRNTEIVDGDLCGKTLIVRFWKDGDSFIPLGMNNRRKLSDFFIDLKLSVASKGNIPIVCNQAGIVWVAGLRLDDRYKVTKDTKVFYKLKLETFHEPDKSRSKTASR